FRAPDRPRGESDERLLDAVRLEELLRRRAVRHREVERRTRVMRSAAAAEREQPIDLVTLSRATAPLRVERAPSVLEADPLGDACQPRQRRASEGAVGKIRHIVAPGSERPDQSDETGESAIGAALVVWNDPPHGGGRLDE